MGKIQIQYKMKFDVPKKQEYPIYRISDHIDLAEWDEFIKKRKQQTNGTAANN